MKKFKKSEFFPSGLALGRAFYNREKEKTVLLQNILDVEPMVVVSPRRYGKTSLITEVIRENELLAISLDFLPASDEEYVHNAILAGIEKLVSLLLQKKSGLKNSLLRLFTTFNPRIVLTAFGQSIEFANPMNRRKTISEALVLLDQAAQSAKQNVVFVMDEFQQVGTLSKNHSIEASIRHAVERAQHVSYIFSGSNRQLLEQMFNDKKRPLYHLCDFIRIDRISEKEYTHYLQKDALLQWHKELDVEVVSEILTLTQRHTYYVNRLCKALWKLPSLPTVSDVRKCWDQYMQENEHWIANTIGNLKPNQRKVLSVLCHTAVHEPQGNAFCKLTGLAAASIKRVMDTMLLKDHIYVDEQGNYKLLDPAIDYYLRLRTIQFFSTAFADLIPFYGCI